MTAFMSGWTAQWYAKVPAASKVWLKVAPGARASLENEPSSAATVWPEGPALVQVTVVPTAIRSGSGANSKSRTMAVVAGAAGPTTET